MKAQVSDLPINKNTEVLFIHMSLNFCNPLVTDGSRGDYESGSRNNRFLCAVIVNYNHTIQYESFNKTSL
jgi:hypothetical protein